MENHDATTLLLELQNQNEKFRLEIESLHRTTGEKVGTEMILRSKISELDEEVFHLKSNVSCMEAERNYEQKNIQKDTEVKISSMQSKVHFLVNQLKESQKKEQRALKDLTMTKNNTMIAHKKMEAKMKLEKKRKWTQDILLSSQTHNQNQNNNSEKVQMTFHSIGLQASFPDVHTFTTPLTLQEKLQRENSNLISDLTCGPCAVHFSLLLHLQDHDSELMSNHSIIASLSLSSQPIDAISQSKDTVSPSDLSKTFRNTISSLLQGEGTCHQLLPVFLMYLTHRNELKSNVLHAVLSILNGLVRQSPSFAYHMLQPLNSNVHESNNLDEIHISKDSNMDSTLSISSLDNITGLTLQYTCLQEALFQVSCKRYPGSFTTSHRSKVFKAIGRVLRNHLEKKEIITSGLEFLISWIESSRTSCEKNLIGYKSLVTERTLENIILSPKTSISNQSNALHLLTLLVSDPSILGILYEMSKTTLLFNRISRLLIWNDKKYTSELERLHIKVLSLFILMTTSSSSYGAQDVYTSTFGHPTEDGGEQNILQHLIICLHNEIFSYSCYDIKSRTISKQRIINESIGLLHTLVQALELSLHTNVQAATLKTKLYSILMWYTSQAGTLVQVQYTKHVQTQATILLDNLHLYQYHETMIV